MTTMQEFREHIAAHLARLREADEQRDCPVCGQGFLVNATVVATDEPIIFYEECDSLWLNGDPIDEASAMAFQTFVNADGKWAWTGPS